jgi:hypothetical protein
VATTTLQSLRRLIGDHTGDVAVLVASHDGTTDTFRDTAHLANRDNRAPSVVKRLFYLPDEQHEASVTDYDGTTRTLTFSPAADAATVAGQEGELWSVAERIGSIGALTRLINYAIESVADIAGPEVVDDAQTFNARTGSLVIPDGWAEFGGAYWTPTSGPARRIPSRFMHVHPSNRLVYLQGAPGAMASRRGVELFGYLRETPLVDEDDTTNVDVSWIVEGVAGILTLAGSWKGGDAGAFAERRAAYWATQAAQYRKSVMSARRGLRISLP